MATSQATIQQLFNLLEGSVDKFVEGPPEVQRQTYTRLLALLKELDTRDTIQTASVTSGCSVELSRNWMTFVLK